MAKNLEICYLMDFYGDMLTEKQREMVEQYYSDDLSLAEIADNFGISRQGVRDAIKHGEAALLELEEKIGFARRYTAVNRNLARLEQLAADIRYCNANNYHTDRKIEQLSREMLDVLHAMKEQEDV